MPKTNGKKRQSPSAERQIALALVEVIEDAPYIEATEGSTSRSIAIQGALKVLKDNGYEGLESISKRVRRIQALIEEALEIKDYDALPRLSQEMKRAEKGLPPLTTEKQTRKPRTPKTPAKPTEKAEKPKRGKKDKDVPGEVPCHCEFTGCTWRGVAVPDSACPVCSTGVTADI